MREKVRLNGLCCVVMMMHQCSCVIISLRKVSVFTADSSQGAGPFTLDVVLSEVLPELRGQRQVVHALVRGAAADQSPAQVLQGEGEGPRQRPGKQGLEEEAGGGVAVVPQQTRHAGVMVHARVAHVKAETLAVLLDACVQGAAVAPEADREEELVLRGVSEQEGALRLTLQQLLGLKAVQHAPVTRTVVDLEEIRDQDVVRVITAALCAPAMTRRVPVLQVGASSPW